MAEATPKDFLLFLVESLVEQPDAVSIEESEGEKGRTCYHVRVDPTDEGTLSDDRLSDALHTAFSAFTYKHRIRASLDLHG